MYLVLPEEFNIPFFPTGKNEISMKNKHPWSIGLAAAQSGAAEDRGRVKALCRGSWAPGPPLCRGSWALYREGRGRQRRARDMTSLQESKSTLQVKAGKIGEQLYSESELEELELVLLFLLLLP